MAKDAKILRKDQIHDTVGKIDQRLSYKND